MKLYFVLLQPGVPAFTVPQPPEAMTVLRQRAEEIGVSTYIHVVFNSEFCIRKTENFEQSLTKKKEN